MMKVVALYTPPTDPEAFEEHYAAVHVPLVASLPSLVRAETSRVAPEPDGSPAAFYRTADLYFESAQDLQAALSSPQGRRTAEDAQDLATRTGSSLTLLVAAVD